MAGNPSIPKLLILAGATAIFAWQSLPLMVAIGLVSGSPARASSLDNQHFSALTRGASAQELQAALGCGELLLLNHEHDHFAPPEAPPLPSSMIVALAFQGSVLPEYSPNAAHSTLIRPPCRLSFDQSATHADVLAQGH